MNWGKYAITFVITATIFGGAFYLSNSLNEKRVAEIESMQEKISLDILSSETQFDLLKEVPCKAFDSSALSEELESLADRLTHTENVLGSDNAEVVRLKKSYFLLEAKDYLLAKRIDEKCKTRPVIILYFYSNADCLECRREGLVLTKLREKYPDLRVYSFDYDFDSPIVRTLISVYEIARKAPAMVVDGEVVYDFYSVKDLEKAFPKISGLKLSEDYATTTEEI